MKELANLIFIGIGFISIRIYFLLVGQTFRIGFLTPCNPKLLSRITSHSTHNRLGFFDLVLVINQFIGHLP